MKKLLAFLFTLALLPIILFGIAGSISLSSNTGNKSGFLFDALLIIMLIAVWWGAFRKPNPNGSIFNRPLPWWVMALFLLLVLGTGWLFYFSPWNF